MSDDAEARPGSIAQVSNPTASARPTLTYPHASSLLLTAFMLSSCADRPPPPDLHGIWQAPGYNSIIEINGDGVALIERTSISCVQSVEGGSLDELFGERPKVTLVDHETLHVRDAIAQAGYNLNRLTDDQRDALCPEVITDEPHDPERNFEIFWKTFDESYAFFDRRGVDWQAAYDEYRKQVDQETTPEELLDIFIAMVAPLRDGHVSLSLDGDDTVGTFTSDVRRMLIEECEIHAPPCERPDSYIDAQARRFMQILKDTYLDGDIETALDGSVFWGKLSSEVGYLHFGSAGDYTDDSSSKNDFESLHPVLDQAFTDLTSLPNLVIDLRRNDGGNDYVGLSLADRLADRRRLVFEKAAFENGVLHAPQQAYVQPTDRPSYSGRVVVLTSSLTASAAEILTMAFRELPQVTLMGMPTAGDLSDVHDRTLPNGFVFGLSNEVYRSADGRVFEGEGVMPDIERPFLPRSDREEGVDSMIDEALSRLATSS